MKDIYCVICGKYRKFKYLKYCTLLIKYQFISGKFGNEDQKIFKEEETIEILKFFHLVINI